MKTRYLFTACVLLIVSSIFVLPGIVRLGLDPGLGTDLSTVSLLGGIAAAVLTVEQDTRERGRIAEENLRR